MTVYNRGDVVLVPFPFSNQATIKKRPSVIVSSDVYNNTSPDIVIMAITGKTDKTLNVGECLIEDWRDAGLLKPSSIKPAVSTIEQGLVIKKLGKLSPKDLFRMENALKEFLDLR
ncbi:MAG: type II toxin-antitoxin system PemK/MazF family toxin [Candidatus Brocadia sp.]|nr:type II toxin-antitoxin system PemK/MazF family toxin [Candidatus Brocadia sp.]MDG6026440.1 type II toxin-antitoxin system PemK/MazF family toxin [Candidatus Brocadia sp.]